MTDLELEELQLQVEGGICKLPIVEMEQLAERVGPMQGLRKDIKSGK